MPEVTVIGPTSWGITLAVIMAQKGLPVSLWCRSESEAQALNSPRESRQRLPGIPFPQTLTVTANLQEAMDGSRLVLLAVPSQRMRDNAKRIAPYITHEMLIMSASKGLELGTALRMSQVLCSELGQEHASRCCALSGPNLAREVAQGLPSATVVAANALSVAEAARELVMTPRFRVYCSDDIIGVEFGGTLKNIIALGAGMSDGWGYGANAKAAFMTRGLTEITRLGVVNGAHPLTFMGLAGIGDLMATCTSPLSRNRRVGEELARGRSLEEITATLGGVAEGITTTVAALDLARSSGVEMPIAEQTFKVLYEGLDARRAIAELMAREPTYELRGIDN
ncbi:MAG: NAD(P)-dependent glycerol-3-phosphate dehydrogenase [Chloroflexi bacterium]|nr:NAD(P)-dependent glycerol-3-phosphate dehydrogenase [Chloroflexota bacterium]